MKRTVRVFQVVQIEDGNPLPDVAPNDICETIEAVLERQSNWEYAFRHSGHNVVGVLHERETGGREKYFYLARERQPEDSPSEWEITPQGRRRGRPLGIHTLEPTVMMAIPEQRAFAIVLGGVGSPSASTIGRWVTSLLGAAQRGLSYELHPVLDPRAETTLAQAVGATRLDLGCEVDDIDAIDDSRLGDALKSIQVANPRMRKLRLTLSMGQGAHAEGDPELLEQARQLAGGVLERLRVGLRVPKSGGGFKAEFLDLVAHRYATRVEIESQGRSVEPEAVASALVEAIGEFRRAQPGNAG